MSRLTILLTAILILALGSGIGIATEIHVNSTQSIQSAVNNASSGDEIIVDPGTYMENIRINSPDLVIRSESENPENTVIKSKSNTTNVFYASANNTIISGFKIESGEAGVYLGRCSGCTVTNNNLTDNKLGIYLSNSNYNKIFKNRAVSNQMYGIQLVSCEGNTLLYNNANSNDRGINCLTSNKSTILGNNVSYNNEFGMWISQSNDNTISGNIANESSRGIHLNSSSRNIFSENIIAFNSISGFFECAGCHHNVIFNNYLNNVLNADIDTTDTIWNTTKVSSTNIVGGSYIGGNCWATPTGTGFSETAQDVDKNGIADTPYNIPELNINDYLPLVSKSERLQRINPVANFSINVTNGYTPLDVKFTDLSQNATSWSWDFGDGNNSTEQNPIHTYSAAGNYTVHLTVSNTNGTDSKSTTITATITVLEQTIPVLPVADFSSNLNSGIAPFEVKFTDASQNATGWKWDFGDGYTSTEQNSTHTYFSAGAYLVSLKVSNVNGTTSKTATINVREKSGSSGGSSSGSAGGAGGSPEPQSNVQAKEISQSFVNSGKNVKFDFPRNATPVVSISFDSKKTAGKTTTIVESLKGKSILVTGLPSNEVYTYLNIWVGNSGFATSKNIENAVVNFKVKKAWIQEKKIDQSSISLNTYIDKKWDSLSTNLSGEDDKYLYLTAKTPGFSSFAITCRSTSIETEVQSATENKTSSEVDDIENNALNKTANIDQTPKKTQSSNTSGKEGTKTPDFEIVSGIVCLMSVLLYKRR
jgi:PGF-pre-PGF domain-containing protein